LERGSYKKIYFPSNDAEQIMQLNSCLCNKKDFLAWHYKLLHRLAQREKIINAAFDLTSNEGGWYNIVSSFGPPAKDWDGRWASET
jgi:hypothetical protein